MDKMFTFAFIFFMISMAVYRIGTVFFTIDKIPGKVVKGWTLYILSGIHIVIGLICVIEYFCLYRTINYWITLVGLVLFSLAFAGRMWSVSALGKYHSAQIEIREHHPIIRSGPYRYIRHPIYLFNIIELLGFPLIPNSYYGFFLSILLYIPFLLLRLFYEEKVHTQHFGDEYARYKSEVPLIIPFTKGLKITFGGYNL